MSNLLRIVFISGAIYLAYLMITQPRSIRMLGRKALTVGLVYALAIVVSAAIRIAGWGT
jgi:hypothetical protein